jgi:hypothetical protein
MFPRPPHHAERRRVFALDRRPPDRRYHRPPVRLARLARLNPSRGQPLSSLSLGPSDQDRAHQNISLTEMVLNNLDRTIHLKSNDPKT